MNDAFKLFVLLIASAVIAGTFVYLGSLLPYPDNFIVAVVGVGFAATFSLVLYLNTRID